MWSTVLVLIAWLVLAALVACVVAALARRAWVWSALVIALAALWPFVNKPIEGPVLWDLPADAGGVTVSDLLAVCFLALGFWLLWRMRSGREAARQERR